MADNSQSTDDLGTNTQTARSVLLKRNPHLRVNDTASPSFGGLGTRQFLQKQLMTPGSATSASSFEEGASYDGFSDAGTPASEESLTHAKAGTSDVEYVTHTTTKQPTKRLSSPSRVSLARRLMGTSTEKHGMLPDDESVSKVTEKEDSNLLNNLVVKTVPPISTSTTMVPLSPRSTKMTRRIIASPRKTLRRVVIRRTGADGRVHEEVQYVDVDGQVVQQSGNFFNAESEDKSAVQIPTPARTLRRVVVRRTGADGQVHEEVQFLDADGNVVESKSSSSSATSLVASTPIRSTLTRRTLRRRGPDGKIYEQIQFLDAEGNVVKTEGDDLDSIPSSSTVAARTVTPGKKIRRVIIRKTGADGQMHEQVQYLDADGNVVSTEGSQVNSGGSKEEMTTEGPDSQSKTTVTRRMVRRILVRKDGTRVEQLVDADGNVIEGESGNLVSVGSFTGSVSSVTSDTSTEKSSRRVVTRRVVASPVRRTVVHNTGSSSSGAESEEEIQYEGSSQRSGRRIVTRRVVTPQRVVRRMVTRKGVANSDDELDIDAEFVHSEGNLSSDESIGGSSRGYTVSDRIVIPGTTRVVSRAEAPAGPQEDRFSGSTVDEALNDALENDDKTPALTGTGIVNTATVESPSEVQTLSNSVVDAPETSKAANIKEDVALVEVPTSTSKVVSALEPTAATQEEPRHSGGGVWGFFSKSNANEGNDRSIPDSEQKAHDHSASSPEDATSGSGAPSPLSNAAIPAVAAGVVGATIITKASSPEVEPAEPHPVQAEGDISVPETPVEVDQPKETGGFWGFFGKSEEPNDKKTAPVDTETHATSSSEIVKETVDGVVEDNVPSPSGDIVQPVAGGSSVLITEELPATAASNDSLEDKTPVEIVQDGVVDVPEPSEVSESNNVLHTAAVASVTTAAVVHALDDKDVEAQDVNARHPLVITTEESKPANVPHRKKARSIWKFWGANKPSPIRTDDNTTDTAASGLVVTEIKETTTVVEEEFESGSVYHDAVTLTASQHSNGHQEAAAMTSVTTAEHSVEIEAVRRSISSNNSPTNVVPVASSGKFVRESERRTTELMDGVEPEIEADDHYVEIASPRHLGSHSDEGCWAVKPCALSWNNLHLKSKNDRNPVLDGVSGSVKAGEFLVITGPSKHESLALLSCLGGFEDAMDGNVTVNGRKWNEKMNRYVAFVMREDLFFETLTVYEHLLSQAKLRMRRTHTDEMLLERVERVIEDLELSNCRDNLIGGGISLTGITPVERKLLALATALLTNPSILLVEEPTDGLDTFSSEKIVSKLRWLAFEKGLTVAVTLHHPSSHFYGLFDVLYLVTNASCVYDGKASDAVAYFSTIGYSCPEFMSPMDYFLLQIGGNREDDDVVARIEALKREWSGRNASVYAENETRAAAASEDAVVDYYDEKNRFYHMSCCGQLGLLWLRHVRRLSRYGFVIWWHLLAALLIGVVFGLVYLQLDLDNQHSIQNFAGSFFYIVVIQLLFTAYRTFVFMPRETAIALRERQEYRGGWYHLLCWYFTKIVAELPALIILSIALFVPVFLLVGIGHGFKVYVYMQIVLVLAGWSAIGLGFLSLGVFRDVTLALIVYSVLLVLFVAFGGLLINVTDIPDWLAWLHYISPVKYAYEAMMKVFWKRVDSIDCDWTLEGCVALTGEGVLKYYSMENRSALGDSLILLAIGFAFFFFAFWFLVMLANKRISGLQWRYDWSFKGSLGSKVQRIANVTASEKHAATRTSTQRVLEGDNYYIQVETPRIGRGTCDTPGITLGWSSLSLTSEKKQLLLTDASGSAKSGEMVLITGPSDESNVALLESLGGLQKRTKGKMTLNGVVSSAQKLSDSSAYVVRDDLFYETLTVEEHLKFQSQLVLASYERVEIVLDELELTAKRHMLIRYLSPADTKLLAVATALLTNPSILLVEEPTYGMDLYASQFVVLKLRQLARGGRTVVVSMAHPSSHIYALFDTLYLLAGGAAVYHGKVREAVSYFASLGYQCPQYMSPADYFARQLTIRGKESEKNSVILFKEAWSTRCSELNLVDSEEPAVESGHRRRIDCCSQFSLLFRRHLLRLSRYRVVFGWHALWMVVLGVIFGLIFLQLDLDEQGDIQNWAGAFFYLIVLQMLVIAYRTFVFLPKEMAVAEREHRFGGYFMACWYLTKLIAELPALLVLSVLLFVPAHLLIGIGHGFKLFVYMQFVMWLAGWSAAGLVTLLLGLFRRVRVALITFVLLLLLFVVFGGLLINVDDVPDYLIWLHYISPVKYGYEALMKLFWGRIFFLACGESDGSGSGSATVATVGDGYDFGMSGSGSYGDDGCIAHSGDEVLDHYSMDNSRSARSDSVILLELTVLYFFIGYVFLSLRWRRYKREQRQWTQN